MREGRRQEVRETGSEGGRDRIGSCHKTGHRTDMDMVHHLSLSDFIFFVIIGPLQSAVLL